MKTIEIISGEQRAIFTTRSVTFDGKEFLYINMTDVSNDPDACVYTFTYDNEIKLLPYEAKDAAVLNAIFGQVIGMAAKKAPEKLTVRLPPKMRQIQSQAALLPKQKQRRHRSNRNRQRLMIPERPKRRRPALQATSSRRMDNRRTDRQRTGRKPHRSTRRRQRKPKRNGARRRNAEKKRGRRPRKLPLKPGRQKEMGIRLS